MPKIVLNGGRSILGAEDTVPLKTVEAYAKMILRHTNHLKQSIHEINKNIKILENSREQISRELLQYAGELTATQLKIKYIKDKKGL